jgi:predicted membrane protein
MVDIISNTISSSSDNMVKFLGINFGSEKCIISGMLVLFGLLIIALVIIIIIGIVKWIKNGGIAKFTNNIGEFFVHVMAILCSAILTIVIFIVGLIAFLFILSLLGKLLGMC